MADHDVDVDGDGGSDSDGDGGWQMAMAMALAEHDGRRETRSVIVGFVHTTRPKER